MKFLVDFTFLLCVFFMCFDCVLLEFSQVNFVENIRHPLEINIETPKIEQDVSVHNRQKRQLLFPIATLLQVSFCVASPVQVKYYNMFLNQGFQLNFALPNNRSQLPSSFFGSAPIIDTARSRTKRDQELESRDESDIYTSENMYFFMGKALEAYGYNGTQCVLHSICHLANLPFEKNEDLLHEIVHFVMTPSEHEVENEAAEAVKNSKRHVHKLLDSALPFDEYLRAESAGKAGKNCDRLYRFCTRSPLESFSEIIYEGDEDVEND